MASKITDRVSLNFYEDVQDDKMLIDYLNRKYNKKFRGQKIKEILMDYLKNTNEFKEFKNNIDKEKEIAVDVKTGKKKQLKGLDTY